MGVPFFITLTTRYTPLVHTPNYLFAWWKSLSRFQMIYGNPLDTPFTLLITQKGKSSLPPKGNYRKKSNKSTIFADLVKLKV